MIILILKSHIHHVILKNLKLIKIRLIRHSPVRVRERQVSPFPPCLKVLVSTVSRIVKQDV